MTYYAQRKSIKNGETTFNNRTGERADMLRQYFLYCASASTNADNNEFDFVDFGTVEQGAVKTESFRQEIPEPVEQGEGE